MRRGRDDGVTFHCIPSIINNQGEKTKEISSRRRLEWIARINRKDWTPSPHSRVCSEHFISGKPASLYEENNPDWAPSRKLGYHSPGPSIQRFARLESRKRRRIDTIEQNISVEDNGQTQLAHETGVCPMLAVILARLKC
jgi:hypothetical protein